jgi:hypothetical protein
MEKFFQPVIADIAACIEEQLVPGSKVSLSREGLFPIVTDASPSSSLSPAVLESLTMLAPSLQRGSTADCSCMGRAIWIEACEYYLTNLGCINSEMRLSVDFPTASPLA